jgi:hypothetical protein
MRKYFIMLVVITIISPSCSKQEKTKQIIGTWIGSLSKDGGYKGTTDTLTFGEDSTFIWKSKFTSRNMQTKYSVKDDSLKYTGNRFALIYFEGKKCLHWQFNSLFEITDYYFTKQ